MLEQIDNLELMVQSQELNYARHQDDEICSLAIALIEETRQAQGEAINYYNDQCNGNLNYLTLKAYICNMVQP